jgi:hypothetical protein
MAKKIRFPSLLEQSRALANLAGAEGSLVTTEMLEDLAITAAKIANLTITAAQIANGAIDTDQLAALAVTAAKIDNNTITASQIAANTITANEIAATTITASEIANLTITAAQIANLTITASEIANTKLTTEKIIDDEVTVKYEDSVDGSSPVNLGVSGGTYYDILTRTATTDAADLHIIASIRLLTDINYFGDVEIRILYDGAMVTGAYRVYTFSSINRLAYIWSNGASTHITRTLEALSVPFSMQAIQPCTAASHTWKLQARQVAAGNNVYAKEANLTVTQLKR